MTEDFKQHMEQGRSCRDRQDFAGAIEHFLAAARLRPGAMVARSELGRTYLQSGALDQAQETFSVIPPSDPAYCSALAGLARVARKRGDAVAAAAVFREAVALQPHDSALRLELAAELRGLARLEEARAEYRIVLAAHPGDWKTQRALGLIARRLGEHGAALESFQSALDLQPGNNDLQCEMAFTLRQLGRLDEAEALYRGVMVADSSAVAPLRGLSLIAQARGDLGAAIASAKSACTLGFQDIDSRLLLASLYRDAGNYGEASTIVDAVLAAAPDHSGAWMERGLIERARDDHAAALAAFRRAAELNRARAWIEAAAELMTLGQPGRAREVYQKVLADSPADPDAMLGMSLLQMTAAEFEACLQTCNTLIEVAPNRLDSYRRKCLALIQLDRADEAVDIAVGLEPDATNIVQADAIRLEIFRTCGRRIEALALLQEPRVSTTRHFQLWLQSVLTYLAFFDLSGAEDALRDPPAVRHYEYSRVHYLHGMLADLQWRVRDSIASFEKALQMYAADSNANHALARLYLLQADVDRASHHLERALTQGASTLLLRGSSRNVSQNLTGQLLNELRLDRDLLAQLAGLQQMEPQQRVEPLLALVRSHAELVPPSMYLMLALRESGAFADSSMADGHGKSPIPRSIVQFWDQTSPPDGIARLLRTWPDAHPDFQYNCFNYATARAYLTEHFPREVLDAYRSAIHPAQACDLFRLAYLYREGGFYLDADDRCVGHLSAIQAGSASLVAYQEQYASLGNNFMGCIAAEPVVGRALALAVEALTRGDSDCIWLASGPGLLTRAFAQILAEQGPEWRDWLRGYRILDRKALVDVSWPHSVLSYKNTRRSWLIRRLKATQSAR
jgi:tetratricopeptide (TPR) repeat protein